MAKQDLIHWIITGKAKVQPSTESQPGPEAGDVYYRTGGEFISDDMIDSHPEDAAPAAEQKEVTLKHLPGQHDQSTHGARHAPSQTAPSGRPRAQVQRAVAQPTSAPAASPAGSSGSPYAPSAKSYQGWSNGAHQVNKNGQMSTVTGMQKDGLGIHHEGKRYYVSDLATGTRLAGFVSQKQAQLFAGVLHDNYDFVNQPPTSAAQMAQVKHHIGQTLIAAGLKPNSSSLQAWGTKALAQVNAGGKTPASPAAPAAPAAPKPKRAPKAKPAAPPPPKPPSYTPSTNSYQGWSNGSHQVNKNGQMNTVSGQQKDGLGIHKDGKRYYVSDLATGTRLAGFVSQKQAQLFAGVLHDNYDFVNNPPTTAAQMAQVKQHIGQMLQSAGLPANSSSLQAWGTKALAQVNGKAAPKPANPTTPPPAAAPAPAPAAPAPKKATHKKTPAATAAPQPPDPADLLYKPAANTDPNQLASLPSVRNNLDYATARVKHSDSADPMLRALYADQGFDGPPSVVPGSKLDQLVKSGQVIEVYRGVTPAGTKSAATMISDYKQGEYFAGQGIHGNGTYLSTDRSTANSYDSGGLNVIRVGIRKDAKMETEANLNTMMARARQTRISYLRTQIASGNLTGGRLRQANRELQILLSNVNAHLVLGDIGRYATAIGIDVIHVPGGNNGISSSVANRGKRGEDYYVVLNRTATYVEQ